MNDIWGKALMDFQNGKYSDDIVTSTSISEEDILPLPYLFRDFTDMPLLEKEALKRAKGRVLDVGCGSGSHSLYLQKKGMDVTAIDISPGAVAVSKQRGVLNVNRIDVLDIKERFDTVILLMNGTGIFQTLDKALVYLNHLKTLLEPTGQVLIDSSDIKYMYIDDDGGLWIDTQSNYYGEIDYYISYKGESAAPMKWLYLDFQTLSNLCAIVGLGCENICDGVHHDYLAKLYLR